MILGSLYDPSPARHWLTTNGGRLLSDAEILELKVRRAVGESWLLPASWSKSGTVVIGLSPLFPDAHPKFFLPHEGRRGQIIPHVGLEDGFICTLLPGIGIDPLAPVEVIKELLAKAEALVTKAYNSEEWMAEVETELGGYWTINPSFNVHHFLDGIPKTVAMALIPMNEESSIFRPSTLQPSNLQTNKHITLCVICPRASLKQLLLDPAAWLRDSGALASALTSLFELFSGRGIPIKTSELSFFIFCEASAGPVLLPAKLKSKVRLKGHSPEDVLASISHKLSTEGLLRGLAEDCSTRRLMRRSQGTESEVVSHLRVAIIGCGSLGGFVADLLARAGVRRFLLIDQERLKVENLPRHVCGYHLVGQAKATALKWHLAQILPDVGAQDVVADFRDDSAIRAMQGFSADITLVAIGETNADLTAARFGQAGLIRCPVFAWAEPGLAAGHIVYLPTGDSSGLFDLFDDKDGLYKYRIIDRPEERQLQERGCQTTYLPFSGMDMAGLSTAVARRILTLAGNPPVARKIYRYSGPRLENHEEL